MTEEIKNLELVNSMVGAHLDDIAALFIPGSKIAVLVLPPDGTVEGNRDFMMASSDFTFDQIIEFATRRKRASVTFGTATIGKTTVKYEH